MLGGYKESTTRKKWNPSKVILVCVIVISWAILSLNYYDNSIYRGFKLIASRNSYTSAEVLEITRFNESSQFLIHTPGCSIPNYASTLHFNEAKIISKSCGTRAIFVEKVSAEHFTARIEENKFKKYTMGRKYTCCYQFIVPDNKTGIEDYTQIRYTECVPFQFGDKLKLNKEMIAINCVTPKPKWKVVYRDVYIVIKKINLTQSERFDESWNVLILGMDTMSRARFASSMPITNQYLQSHNWLDFRGYQKVGYNTFPNLMALMTGKNMSEVHKACNAGMDKCNNKMLWSHFKKARYVTATGEDYLRLPDTFTKCNGYKIPPTDHYMRPFFLTGETSVGNLICTKNQASAKHLLDYARDFSKTYAKENFFGMFWTNSFSHNLQNVPSLIDADIVDFFEDMNRSGVLNNTFVFFLSDHGIRYGQIRVPYESYYEERLPMLHMWVPSKFRDTKLRMYMNLVKNQNRLITPYDLYNTVLDILALSRGHKSTHLSDACPKCISIFEEVSQHRSCEDVNVDEKWCSCRDLMAVKKENPTVLQAINSAVKDIQNKIKNIETTQCMECENLKLKTILRAHKYTRKKNETVYVIAFKMKPGEVSYEANIEHRDGRFNIINSTETISTYNTRGNCVNNPVNRAYCICKKQPKCKIKN